ncbi:MAG: group III truncated hemoglobin [Acidobacteriota bacterium]
MKSDIKNRDDIDRLMSAFYARAMTDDRLGYIFMDVANLDLDRHLPIIGDFWETMLFRTGDYSRHGRNPLEVCGELNEMTPLLPEHFERWLEIFTTTIDELFKGETAEFTKLRAAAIARRMLEFVISIAPGEIGRSAASLVNSSPE